MTVDRRDGTVNDGGQKGRDSKRRWAERKGQCKTVYRRDGIVEDCGQKGRDSERRWTERTGQLANINDDMMV